MDCAVATPRFACLQAQMRFDESIALAVDKLLPFDTTLVKPQLVDSDCCSSNNYPTGSPR